MSTISIPLTKAEALVRSSIVEPNIYYKIFLCLRKGPVYEGFSQIKFRVTNKVSRYLQKFTF
jgi:hypothetical protein